MKPPQLLRNPEAEAACAAVLALLVLFILPLSGSTALVVGGSATALAAQVALFPDRFRTQSGSLALAIGLVTALAIAAGVIAALSLIQRHWG